MDRIKLVFEQSGGVKQTYSKETEYDLTVEEFFEAVLEAYDSFGFVNEVDVEVENTFLGNTLISYNRANHVSKRRLEGGILDE